MSVTPPCPYPECLERLAAIEAVTTRMETRLFGNGQPGELSTLKSRVDKLERVVWRVTGAAGLLTFVAGVVTAVFRR